MRDFLGPALRVGLEARLFCTSKALEDSLKKPFLDDSAIVFSALAWVNSTRSRVFFLFLSSSRVKTFSRTPVLLGRRNSTLIGQMDKGCASPVWSMDELSRGSSTNKDKI